MTEPNAITAYAKNAAHVAQALGQLAGQFHGKPHVEGLLQSWMVEVQAVENALWQVLVSGAAGDAVTGGYSDALDKLGELVGIARQSLSDTDYYYAIVGAVIANNSPANPNYLYDLVLNSCGLMATITEGYPAAVRVDPGGVLPHFPSLVLLALARRTKPAGVKLNLLDYPSGDLFEFASGSVVETDAAHGWSDTGMLVGGKMVGVLE